jgi:hypothetical protein
MDLKEIIEHPVSAVVSLAAFIGQFAFGWVDAFFALISATATYWFPGIAAFAGTVMPNIGYGDLGTTILVAAAVLYAAVQVNGLINYFEKWKKA